MLPKNSIGVQGCAWGIGPRYGYAGAMLGLNGLAMGSRRKMVVSSARSRQGRDLFLRLPPGALTHAREAAYIPGGLIYLTYRSRNGRTALPQEGTGE